MRYLLYRVYEEDPNKILVKYPALKKYDISISNVQVSDLKKKQERLFIKIDTTEELRSLIKDLRNPLVIDTDNKILFNDEKYDTIEIYDDYME